MLSTFPQLITVNFQIFVSYVFKTAENRVYNDMSENDHRSDQRSIYILSRPKKYPQSVPKKYPVTLQPQPHFERQPYIGDVMTVDARPP